MILKRFLYTSAITISALLPFSPDLSARSEYWEQRVSLFDNLPVSHSDIIFLGNSITDGGEWTELFNNTSIKNRGISGDVISGVRERLHQVTKGKPCKIFLLIGINDISHDIPAKALAQEYETLVKEIRKNSPATKLYIQSVMPINNDFARYKNLKGKEQVVEELNSLIKDIAKSHDTTFIDLSRILAGTDGKLRKDFTNDGLHLMGPGYKAWANHIKKYVEE